MLLKNLPVPDCPLSLFPRIFGFILHLIDPSLLLIASPYLHLDLCNSFNTKFSDHITFLFLMTLNIRMSVLFCKFPSLFPIVQLFISNPIYFALQLPVYSFTAVTPHIFLHFTALPSLCCIFFLEPPSTPVTSPLTSSTYIIHTTVYR